MTYTKPPGVHPQSFSRGCGLSERDPLEMKWFKHYENAHTNNLIQAIINGKNGLENGMRYWLLLEFLCREFKKDTTEFVISKRRLMDHLRFRQGAKLIEFLELLTSYSEVFDELLFSYSEVTSEFSQNFLKIKTPIILELMGKDFKRTRQGRGSDTSKNKEIRIKKKEKNIKKDLSEISFDFEALYQKYPRKIGKKKGIEFLNRYVKNTEQYENISKAIENYAAHCKIQKTESQFIKHFSTFLNCWEDWQSMPEEKHVTRRTELGLGSLQELRGYGYTDLEIKTRYPEFKELIENGK